MTPFASTAWIKDGVMHTDDTLVDGLEADIAMKGSVNLVRRDLNMEAVVAPEISATVGVAAAFAVNPIVGAAVFAASKSAGTAVEQSLHFALSHFGSAGRSANQRSVATTAQRKSAMI
ncbi:membrane protein [Escherichia coli]|uniref:Membrane protein n=1 Tax=Escherichia coli TaxID=562 RepID=A0A376VV28_ECOLX|nr:membrane protein [Escherichia coli]